MNNTMVREIRGVKINPKSSFKNQGAQNTRGRKLREQIRYKESTSRIFHKNGTALYPTTVDTCIGIQAKRYSSLMPLMYFNAVLAACARVVNYYKRERPTIRLLRDAYRTPPTESSTGLPLFFSLMCISASWRKNGIMESQYFSVCSVNPHIQTTVLRNVQQELDVGCLLFSE